MKALNRAFLAPCDARSYAAFRIAFAVAAFLNLLQIWPDRVTLLSDQGLFERPSAFFQFSSFSFFFVFHEPSQVTSLMVVAAAAILLLGVGAYTRTASIVVWLWHASYCAGMYPALSASDSLFRAMSFLVMISPCGSAWSFDELRRRRERNDEFCPLQPRYGLVLMRFQLTLVYFTTFLAKVPDPGWISGDATGFFLLSVYMRRPLQIVADFPRLVVVLSYWALAIELCVPFLLWNRRTRPLGFILGWGMHGTILLVSRLGMFSLITMATYTCFLDSEDIEAVKRATMKILGIFGSRKMQRKLSQQEELSHVTVRPTLEA